MTEFQDPKDKNALPQSQNLESKGSIASNQHRSEPALENYNTENVETREKTNALWIHPWLVGNTCRIFRVKFTDV